MTAFLNSTDAAGSSSMTQPIVRFTDVTKRYGNLTVLNKLNLDVAPGEKVAIIGPSGSGKSTLLRALMTLESIDEGVICVDDEPLTHMPARDGRLEPASASHQRKVRGNGGRQRAPCAVRILAVDARGAQPPFFGIATYKQVGHRIATEVASFDEHGESAQA